MEVKKTPKASLENKRALFIEIGLIVALAVVYIAFDWTSKDVQVSTLEAENQVVQEEEIIPITQETPPPPPEAPKVPVLSDR